MIDRGINASAAMIILNPEARNTVKFGMDNSEFSNGTVKYVGSEIRSVLLSKMQINEGKNICVISGASIAVEAAILDGEGDIVAVEYSENDRNTVIDNIDRFGLQNVKVIDRVTKAQMSAFAVPDVTMLVASASMEQEIECLLELNPKMEFVIYTLDFVVAAEMPKLCEKYGIRDPEIMQISVSKLNSKNTFNTQPAPWIITFKAGE